MILSSIRATGRALPRNLSIKHITRGRLSSSMPEFTINKTRKSPKWVPITIFGATFGMGWFFTQHMTFTDLMAYWRYDSLPEDAQEVKDYKLQLYNKCEKLPVVKQLGKAGYVEIFPPRRKEDLLIDRALSTPGGIAIPPRFFFNPTTKETVGIYHLGMKLTGYPFIVHGGILATIMEDLMRESVKLITQKTDEKINDLSISYKFPTLANQIVIVRTTQHETFGKNIKLTAEVMDQTGNRTLIKGRGSFSASK